MNCSILDPCLSLPCHPNATCFTNHIDQNVQCTCLEGFTGDGWNCIGICELLQCHSKASCIPDNRNQVGVCLCNSGYTGNGLSCIPVSPCPVCHQNATCITSSVTLQPPMCTCNNGFTGDGLNCVLIDYCTSVSCGLNATCKVDMEREIGVCRCAQGLLGDPIVMCITRESCDLLCGTEDVVCVGGVGERSTTCVSLTVQTLQEQVATVLYSISYLSRN